MFTKNWYYGLMAASNPNVNPTAATWPNIKNLDGGSPTKWSSAYMAYWNSFCNVSKNAYTATLNSVQTSFLSSGGVVFGTGTTAPKVDDYCLSGDLITTITSSVTVTMTPDDTGVTITGLYTLTNTGSSSITIGEVGLIASTTTTGSTTYHCLLDRTVLDSPVTIPAGGVGQVTYTIRMDYPTE